MNNYMNAFEHIMPFLTKPLVLIGFGLMLIFSIHKQLLKARIIPELDKEQGSRIAELLLRYGFLLGMLIMLLGFGLEFYQKYVDKEIKTSNQAIETTDNINQIVTTLTKNYQLESQHKDEQIKALTETVLALSKGEVSGTEAEIKKAFSALKHGDSLEAKKLFTKVTQKGEDGILQTAEAYANLGNLEFDNPENAIYSYRRATELAPNNAKYWFRLGESLDTFGADTMENYSETLTAYSNALSISEKSHNQNNVAKALGLLGDFYSKYGDTKKGAEFFSKRLEYNQKEGMPLNERDPGTVSSMEYNIEQAGLKLMLDDLSGKSSK